MWDMTNVSGPEYSDASLQRATYSDYCAENCFKAGVFYQMCEWLGNDNLWSGVSVIRITMKMWDT